METISPEGIKILNKKFCELVGIRKISAYITNNDTQETRYYAYPSAIYKPPKGWVNTTSGVFSEPKYPDLTKPNNFIKLINIQWDLFKNLGPQYIKISDESFEVNYLTTKIAGIKLCQSFGGGELLEEYLETVRNTDFYYDL